MGARARACASLVLLAAAPVAAEPDAVGRWLTADRDGVIEVFACDGDTLCGRIVGMTEPYEKGRPKLDVRGHPQCGLTIMTGFHPAGRRQWEDGRITNPEDGRVYAAEMSLRAPDTLALRGYVLITLLGATQTWTRFSGEIGKDCGFTPPR